MRVSFDLDDVLFVAPEKYATEPAPSFPFKRLFSERLRKGTPQLIHALQERGFEVCFDGIVNAQRHLKEVQRDRKECLPQKLPNFYRISLHIDDENVVRENAARYGYRVFRVYEPDEHWVEKVLDEAERVKKLEEAEHA